MNTVSKKNSYWKDVLLQTSGNTIAQIIGLLGMPILTRLYLPDAFALQAIFVQLVTVLTAFITFRYEYFIQLVRDESQSNSLLLWLIYTGLIMTIFITLGMFVLEDFGFFSFFKLSFSKYYYLAPFSAYLIGISLALKHEAERQEDFKTTSIAEVYSKLGYTGIGIIFGFFSKSIGLILTTLFGALGRIISLRTYLKSFLNNLESIKINKYLILSFSKRSIGLVSSNTILSITSLIPILFISRTYGANNLGQFSLVMSTIFLPSGLIGSAVGNVFYQRSAKLWNTKDFIALKILWKETILKLFVLAVPTYFIVFLASPWVYPLVFGENWGIAGYTAQIMTIAAFFSFLAGPIDRISLVLEIGSYLPIIHFLRLSTVGFSIIICFYFGFNYIGFITFLSISLSLIYALDLCLGRFYLIERYSKYE